MLEVRGYSAERRQSAAMAFRGGQRPKNEHQIREAAEKEEYEFYHRRAPKEWLEALAPLGTDENKPYLEAAPYLIAIFAQTYGLTPDGNKVKNHYVTESVGIAAGMLVTAVHMAGLVSSVLRTIYQTIRSKLTQLIAKHSAPDARQQSSQLAKALCAAQEVPHDLDFHFPEIASTAYTRSEVRK